MNQQENIEQIIQKLTMTDISKLRWYESHDSTYNLPKMDINIH